MAAKTTPKTPKPRKQVETLTHDEASRKNIPTVDCNGGWKGRGRNRAMSPTGAATATWVRSASGAARTNTLRMIWSTPFRGRPSIRSAGVSTPTPRVRASSIASDAFARVAAPCGHDRCGTRARLDRVRRVDGGRRGGARGPPEGLSRALRPDLTLCVVPCNPRECTMRHPGFGAEPHGRGRGDGPFARANVFRSSASSRPQDGLRESVNPE